MAKTNLWRAYWALTALLLAGGVAMLFVYTPVEATMGPIQKVFYVHMPSAVVTLLACLVVFVASIAYVAGRNPLWDGLAAAAARAAVLLASVALVTGMVWAKKAWGVWWTGSPRLTFTLVLWLLYVVYLVVRSSVESRDRRALVAAVYGIIAFLDVPLVYLSARMIPDIHPGNIHLDRAMIITLVYWFVPVLLVAAGLICGGLARTRRELEKQAASAGPPALSASHDRSPG